MLIMTGAAIGEGNFSPRTLSIFGFTYLLIALYIVGGLVVNAGLSLPTNFILGSGTIEEQCALNQTRFNVNASWQCSKFSEGSLAERCASNPELFDTVLSKCSRFIPPTNPAE
jgi:hypothetical protein